jgi:gamma-glutamylcyclotransferase (GGCT)/AIG2-like uncharacterized protein YtfP
MIDPNRRHGERVAVELGDAVGLTFEYRFDLGEHGVVDWCASLDDRRLLFLEFEFAQRHPSTNVAKCWPWLKQNPESRVLLIHAYDKVREQRRPKGSRRRLAAFLGAELATVLDGRFRYLAIDVPPDREAIQEVRGAVARFRSPSDALDRSKPLFVYGFLRPGELAYHQIGGYVAHAEPASVSGEALERDGLLILAAEGNDEVFGDLLRFEPQQAELAYRAIDELEPRNLYRWAPGTAVADGKPIEVNMLVAATAARGSHRLDYEWSSRTDPLFTEALDEINLILEPGRPLSPGSEEIRAFFRYQMAYLLLWSAIERYASLRWGFGGGPVQRVKKLAREPAFVRALQEHAAPGRVVYRADNPGASPIRLDPGDATRAIDFYYQVRSNITHRGKAAHDELSLVFGCLSELNAIFRDVLTDTLGKPN